MTQHGAGSMWSTEQKSLKAVMEKTEIFGEQLFVPSVPESACLDVAVILFGVH